MVAAMVFVKSHSTLLVATTFRFALVAAVLVELAVLVWFVGVDWVQALSILIRASSVLFIQAYN